MGTITNIRRARFDEFYNRFSGYGGPRDHGQQYTWSIQGPRFSRHQLDDLYAKHELAWKIVDLLPDHALRKWIHFPKLDEKKQTQIRKILKGAKLRQALSEGLKINRQYGALLYVDIQDGGSDSDPVNFDNIQSIGEVQVIERDYIWPKDLKRTLRYTHYEVMIAKGDDEDDWSLEVPIHRSRILRLPSCTAPRDWLLSNNGWPPAVLERCIEPLIGYAAAHGLIPNILKDVIRDVIKMFDLNNLSINDCDADQADFNARLDAMFMAQSLLNKLVIDSQDDFVRQTTNLAGIPETVGITERRLIAASGLPHTVLLGESPGSSLSQGGSSQDRDLNKAVEAFQEDGLRPVLESFFEFVAPLIGEEEIEFCFNPLDVPTTKEQAETLKLVMEAGAIGIDSGMISAAEAATMIEGDELRPIPALDLDARAAMESAHAEVIEDLLKVPEPPPELNPNGGPPNGQDRNPQSPQGNQGQGRQ